MELTPNQFFIQEVKNILDMIFIEYEKQNKIRHPKDIRPAFLGLPGNILHSLVLHLEAVNDTITWPHWWQKNYNRKELLPNDIQAIDECSKLVKHSYIVFFFGRIESLHRKSINVISPGFDLENKKPYKQIYDRFLTKLELEHFIPLFDITRNIRNSIHTNGHYLPYNCKDLKLNYKDKVFEFYYLQQIDFMTIENFIFLLKELSVSLIETLNSSKFSVFEFIENKFN